ncbi:MAG: zinc transporter [Candidatus Bathyarchaeia archaeon]
MEIIHLGFVASLLAGLATGAGALPIFFKKSFSDDTLDVLLGFAAGAMLFVVIDEMVPESHRKGFGRKATFGLIGGFAIMMLLDSLFA